MIEAIAAVLVASGSLCVLGVVWHVARAQWPHPAPVASAPKSRTPGRPRNIPMSCVARPVGGRAVDVIGLN